MLRTTSVACSEETTAIPFIKWVGGKRSLLTALTQYVPAPVSAYYEPFLGGGALFFALAAQLEYAHLSDTNPELITSYRVVKEQLPALLPLLEKHEEKHQTSHDYYYQMRNQRPEDDLHIAARFIYLNKTCYNGLYRVNRNGDFNVPRGSYAKPVICDEARLRAASQALQKASLHLRSFDEITDAQAGDFIYCDPPYDTCFQAYQASGFNHEAQQALRDTLVKWKQQGVRVMASNADTPYIRELYKDFSLHEVWAPRYVNAKASGRGKQSELIITHD